MVHVNGTELVSGSILLLSDERQSIQLPHTCFKMNN
jgi:hypothetical protein